MPVLGSPVCEWPLWIAMFQAYWWCLFLALQEASGCCSLLFSNLLTLPVLGLLVCEWLLWLAEFKVCWQCLSWALQGVSGCCGLVCFAAADNACSWISREWVAAVAWCVLQLLTMPVLVSPGSEWLLWLAVFQGCQQWLSLALQKVGGCCGLLCFEHVDNACPWL